MNLIIIMIDSLRADHLGCYGNKEVKTPNIDEFSKYSVLFEHFYPEGLPTVQVRRAIFTGRYTFPWRDYRPSKDMDIIIPGWQPLKEDDITISEILSGEGYYSALITDTLHLFKPGMNYHRYFGVFRFIRGQTFDKYGSLVDSDQTIDKYIKPSMRQTDAEDTVTNKIKGLKQYLANTTDRRVEEDYFAPRVFREGMRWLEENRGKDKLFLWLDVFDPHEPWDPPKHYTDMYDPDYKGKEIIWPKGGDSSYLTVEELNHIKALYKGEVTMVDKWFGYFIDKVIDLGMWSNSLIMVLSDHGHPFSEHGIMMKEYSHLYEEMIRVPLIIKYPGENHAGMRVEEIVQTPDILPTILNILDIKKTIRSIQGEDIDQIITGKKEKLRDYAICGMMERVCVKDKKWKLLTVLKEEDYPFYRYNPLTTYKQDTPELYDLEQDPEEKNNIAHINPGKVKELESKLQDFLRSSKEGDPNEQ